MKTLIVTGTFCDLFGKASTVSDIFCKGFISGLNEKSKVSHVNGGSLTLLRTLVAETMAYDSVVWFPNVSNDIETKFVKQIKQINKKCSLVVSKRNDNGKYSDPELINIALKNRASLLIEMNANDAIFAGRLLDLLGNLFLNWTSDFADIGRATAKRLEILRTFTRVRSHKADNIGHIPNETEFFSLVRDAAQDFGKLIPKPSSPERFVGNASFRCQEGGFPSFRHENKVYVSRRNIDKTNIIRENFVPVDLKFPVRYYGDNKPSVDAPIHIKLYQKFSKVSYMLHGHVYIEGAPTIGQIGTGHPIPCGSLEEADRIIECVESWMGTDWRSVVVNLKGHGFIAMAHTIDDLRSRLNYKPRPMLEPVND